MKFEDAVSTALRLGVVASIALIIAGMALVIVNGGSYGYSTSSIFSISSKINSSNIPLGGLPAGALSGGLYLIMLGLAVLIATPAFRVLISIFAFAHERNAIYTAITIIVFANLFLAILVVPALIS